MTPTPDERTSSLTAGATSGGFSEAEGGLDHQQRSGDDHRSGQTDITAPANKKGELLPPLTIAALVIGLGTGLLAGVLFAWRTDNRLEALGSALIFSAAALISGGAIGFLFGVPRSTAQPENSSARTTEGSGPQQTDYQLNTNLQQISDWLTKVIVGVALTQLGTIRSGASALFDAMAPALGGTNKSAAFAGGITVYFGVFGFLMGWLAASLSLPLYLDGLTDRRRKRLLNETCCLARPAAIDEGKPTAGAGVPHEVREATS